MLTKCYVGNSVAVTDCYRFIVTRIKKVLHNVEDICVKDKVEASVLVMYTLYP